jgi:hypothetical protein
MHFPIRGIACAAIFSIVASGLSACSGGSGATPTAAKIPSTTGTHPKHPALTSLPTSWKAIGTANWITVDSSNNVYAVSTTPAGATGNDSIQLYNGSSWSSFGPSFGAAQISVASDGTLMALTAQHAVYHYTSGAWALMSGISARAITATTVNRVYVVTTTEDGTSGNYYFYWWNGSAWVTIGGGAGSEMTYQPSSTGTPILYGVNTGHDTFYWTGSAWATWSHGTGDTATLAAGPNPETWRVDPSGLLWYWDGSTWTSVSTTGISGAIAQVAVGSEGTPFVRTTTGNVYEPGVGPDGSAYVLSSEPIGGVNGLIANYAQGVTTPPPTSTITSLPNATWDTNGRMTFDAAGDLWVAYTAAPAADGDTEYFGIAEYPPGASGSTAPIRVITPASQPYAGFQGIAIDSSGEIYVPDQTGAIDVYAASASGSSTPIRTISGAATKLVGASKLSFDASGNLWVSTGYGIVEFPPNASGNVAPIGNTMDSTWDTACNGGSLLEVMSFAFDPQGNLIVAVNRSPTNVLEIPAGFTDTTCPSSIIETGLGGIYDIAVDDAGYFYAIDSTGILAIYPENGSGVVAPYASIQGTGADMGDPTGVAVWTNTGWLGGNARHHALKAHKRHG